MSASDTGWREVPRRGLAGHVQAEWRKLEGGLTLSVWQGAYDVPRDNFQPEVRFGRGLCVQADPDRPSLAAAKKAAEAVARAMRKALR